jgi:hypothetical protein
VHLQVLPIRLRPLLLALALLAGVVAASAHGERRQHGNLIVSLDGQLAPLTLPRDRPAPIAVQLRAGLESADGSTLPRVTTLELGIPRQGAISTRGLPICPPRRINDATTAGALERCRSALIGSGRMVAEVKIPDQDAFAVHARLLAFNGRIRGRRAVILHGTSPRPPSSVILPFLIRPGGDRYWTTLVAHLPSSLGPWPRFARFEMSLYRRYRYKGERRSYLSAACPIPRSNTAGFFPFAKADLTLDGGRRMGISILRGCRAR